MNTTASWGVVCLLLVAFCLAAAWVDVRWHELRERQEANRRADLD